MSSERIKQNVVPKRRVAKTRRMDISIWTQIRDNARLIGRIAVAIVTLSLLIIVYQKVVAWSAFQLRVVEVSGNSRISSQEVERIVRKQLSTTLISTSLNSLQDNLEKLTWIRSVQLTRILPDTLRIRIEERKPLALVRFEAQPPVWIDEDGIILGEYDSALDKDVPPLVFGFTKEHSEAAQAENHERIELYRKVMAALDEGQVKLSAKVEEIDLSNLKDIRLQLSRGGVEVDLGDRDFHARLIRALNILDALRRQDRAALKDYKILDTQLLEDPSQIRFISVVHPTQVAIRAAKVSQNRTAPEKVARSEGER